MYYLQDRLVNFKSMFAAMAVDVDGQYIEFRAAGYYPAAGPTANPHALAIFGYP